MEGDMNDFLALVPFDYEAAVRLYAGCLGTILSIYGDHHCFCFHCGFTPFIISIV